MDYLSVTRIPRYMIYDKEGNLVEGDAPRPGSPQIKEKLNKYLNKKV